ncbi:ATP cone domain-containing protein, partial [Tannerella forsythia]
MDFKNIIKRDGTKERYNVSKIKRVIRAAFASIKEECPKEALTRLIENVEERLRELAKEDEIKVEQIQDVVEIELMRNGFYREARRFILYREERAKYRAIILEIEETVTHEGMHRLLKDIQKDFPHLNQSFDTLGMKYRSFHKAA